MDVTFLSTLFLNEYVLFKPICKFSRRQSRNDVHSVLGHEMTPGNLLFGPKWEFPFDITSKDEAHGQPLPSRLLVHLINV